VSNSYREVSSQSWFSRIGQSIKSVLVGLVMFVVAFPLLFWNESRAVQTTRSLKEGSGAVVSVQADKVDPANEGRLVHVSGPVTAEGTLTDEQYGVSAEALKLVRHVEMYQWTEDEKSEEKKKLGGGTETVTTYDYKKEWSDKAVDSSSFSHPEGHENPGALPVESETLTADPITLGAFTLSPELAEKLGGEVDLPVSQEQAAQIPEGQSEGVQVENGRFYLGENPSSPQIGDARISFQVVNPGPRSLIAAQVGETFEPYATKAGDAILLLEEGTKSAVAMFKTAQDANMMMTWILRAVGFFVMFLGLLMIFKPIAVLGDVVPLVGTILGAGLGLFSFLTALFLSLVTIAISWIFVRPLLGISLLVVALAALAWLISVGMKKKKARAGLPPVPVPA
jgi:Transmembrane protein 43